MAVTYTNEWSSNLKAVFWLTIVAGCITSFHSITNSHTKDLVWNTLMFFSPDSSEYYSTEQILRKDMAIWKDNDGSLKHGAAILTRYTQKIIYLNQRKCNKERTAYQVQNYLHGMGSELMLHASILALSIENDALFSWGDGACMKFKAHCRQLYEMEHACSKEQLYQMNLINITHFSDVKIPKRFISKLPGSFTAAQLEFWWRTQAMGYLMRFNSNTKSRIQKMRSDLHGDDFSLNGAININIRSGDKKYESRLSPTESFIDKAEILIKAQPLSYSRTLFVTSDNLEEILKAKKYAHSKQLKVIFSDIPRMKNGHDAGNVDFFWDYNVTISVLMQLSMTSECDAWIGTRSSNWNRIIDMYRCARKYKCKQIFIEAGDTIQGHYDYRPFGNI